MKIVKLTFLLLLICTFSSCDFFDYHPYDGRLDSKVEIDVNQKNIVKIESVCKDKDIIRFVFMGDTQGSIDEAEDFVKSVNKAEPVDFVIHGGDLTEFGLTKEYEWLNKTMAKLKYPYVALIGNHDAVGNGYYVYESIYGNDNFSFIAGDTKFICLNTNALEYDYSKPVPDFNFLKHELSDTSSYSHTVVVMHAQPGSEQFNNNIMEVFHSYIKEFPSLEFCLHAHKHSYSIENIFGDEITYYGCENIRKRSYLLFTLSEDGFTHEKISF